ncbi:alpha/beta hydrolase [Negadavirga shengliensis]|uniref:Alpha/beta hydrolase n=1 Tax=Negadavirga shengliensis TaxID=1389218 RepID=A0ABV9T4K5_9BACT
MEEVTLAGQNMEYAERAVIMLHGRGADAHSILTLKEVLGLEEYALLAPQAPDHTWYPYSFMAPEKENEPYLSRSLATIDRIVHGVMEAGKESERIYFVGFSQGACLCLDYVARHARRYGGVVAFTGGLIGEDLKESKYKGEFDNTPVFIGASHRDVHVPLARIKASAALLEDMGADVKTMIFEDTLHTIRREEVDWVKKNILKS